MIDGLVNIIRREVQRMAGLIAQPRVGIVDGYNPTNFCVRVRLQPGDQITGWLPILTMWGGNGWGLFAPPQPGDVVKVLFQEGGKEAGVCLGRFFSNKTRPLNVPGGEFWLVHKTGSMVKLTNDGKVTVADKAGSSIVLDGAQKITLTDKGGSTLVMNGDGTGAATFSKGLTVNGDFTVTGKSNLQGNVTGSGTATFSGDVKGSGHSLSNHTHGGVQGGSAFTQPPTG